jgi:DNA-binding response OmpR family regulator
VVDDDAHIRAAARALLVADGFEVFDLGSAADALVLLRHQPIDLVIVDLDVARREGIDLAEAICSAPEFDRTSLIGVTTDVTTADLELLDLALQKPYATADLPRVVREVLAK